MPHPFFGAKDVFYIEKKVAKKKLFLAKPACIEKKVAKLRGQAGGLGLWATTIEI